MTIPRPHFDRTLNYGHVIQSLLMVITIAGGFTYLVKWQGAVDSQLEAIAEMRRALVPAVENLKQSDALQDQKINTLDKTLDNIADTVGKTNDALADIAKSVAVIEERTKKVSPN
jgi:hypothetical protein